MASVFSVGLFNFFSCLPRSWKLLFSFTGKLIVIKKACISNLADLLNHIVNKILVNVIKKIFIFGVKKVVMLTVLMNILRG